MRAILFAVGVITLPLLTAAAAPPLAFLRAEGTRLVDEKTRQPVLLKGCNLGNWLMIEPWMLGGVLDATDQVTIIATFKSRFGEERGQALIDRYRANYIRPRDFELLKTFGFNVVRLPFDYRMIQEDQPPYRIRPQAFVHLDRALEMAEAAGIYVILDLHGTPGGNSRDMHTGQANQPGMWRNPVFYQRTADVWRAVADHYKDRAIVAAYDLVNEPYADHKLDVRPELVKLMPQLYHAIREVDDRHVIFFPGALRYGIEFYGDPKQQRFHDVGFTEHRYAGLFGDKPVLESHARELNDRFPKKQAYIERLGVPYYFGEFNVVRSAAGGDRVMRAYFDRAADFGWTATMWSYKLLKRDAGVKPDPWYMVTNAAPLPKLDLQSSSYEEFERFFDSLATMELAVNEPLRKALTEPNPPPLPLSTPPPTTAPTGSPASRPALTASRSLLQDLPFDRWNSEGSWTRDAATATTASPTQSAALWRDVDAEPAKRYTFTISARREPGPTAAKADATIEVRLEGWLGDHPLVLNSNTSRAAELSNAGDSSPLSVASTAVGTKLRVRVIVSPTGGSEGGAPTVSFSAPVLAHE